MKWWLEEPKRMVQTNLREIDINFDLEAYVASLKEFHANVVLFNVGGIVANYHTELDYQYKNPRLQGDVVERLTKRLKQEQIRLLARFDFSKVNEKIAVQHPDWLYISPKGEHVNYNGQVHVCINSPYQQEHSKTILREAIEKLDIDGIFFNMIGYVTRDYSGNYHGICQCDNCRRIFKERYGLDLPLVEDPEDPVFRVYDSFRVESSKELFDSIRASVKAVDEQIAICNYTHDGSDIFRKEAHTEIDGKRPQWNLHATENVKTVLDSWSDMAISNAAVHFIDFPYRHAAVSPNLTAIRLAQDVVNRGWLDYYVIGHLLNQDDRNCFDRVKEIYAYHEDHISYLTHGRSIADVCVVIPNDSNIDGSKEEFRGMLRMLTQQHILFDLMHFSCLGSPDLAERLARYQMVVLPDVRNLGDAADMLDDYVKQGGRLLSTGATGTYQGKDVPSAYVSLSCTGIDGIRQRHEKTRGLYFRIPDEDKKVLTGLDQLDILYLDSLFLEMAVSETADTYFKYISKCMYGPPEKCYYTDSNISDVPGMIVNRYGTGISAYIPWGIGRQYEYFANNSQHLVITSIVDSLIRLDRTVKTACSELIEISLYEQQEERRMVLNLINHTGQFGTAFFKNLPIYDIEVSVKTRGRRMTKAYMISDGRELDFSYSADDELTLTIPYLDLFAQVVLEETL